MYTVYIWFWPTLHKAYRWLHRVVCKLVHEKGGVGETDMHKVCDADRHAQGV